MAQIAMTVAEELNCAWHHARVVNASVQRNHLEGGVYAVGFQPFFGGHSTQPPRFAHGLQLGASARERLKAAAAARWAVPVGEVEASESVLTHKPSGRTLRYGDVAAAAASVKLPEEPKPKPRAQWRLIGKASPAKLSIPDMTRGKAIYGIDVRLPGMVYAALMQAPLQGGRLKSYKPEAVLKMPGVRAVIVIDPAATKGSPVPQKSTFGFDDTKAQSGGAVIADHYWQARTALEALPLEWEAGPGGQWADDREIYDAARAFGAAGQPDAQDAGRRCDRDWQAHGRGSRPTVSGQAGQADLDAGGMFPSGALSHADRVALPGRSGRCDRTATGGQRRLRLCRIAPAIPVAAGLFRPALFQQRHHPECEADRG